MYQQDTNSFDLADPQRTRAVPMADPDERYGTSSERDDTVHELDSPENEELHRRLMTFYTDELDRQKDNRQEMATDHDFYDGIQWTEHEANVVRERGQNPMVLNVISQTINWVTGSERRGRTDFKVLPRRKEGSKPAERKTQLLKYLSDTSNNTFHRSRAFEDTVIAGLGWLEDALTEGDGEILDSRYENWRNIVWDSASTEMDLSDCRYLFRFKWVDLDIATAIFTDRAGLLERSAGQNGRAASYAVHGDDVADQYENERLNATGTALVGQGMRRRVRLIEAWFVRAVPVKRLSGGEFHGELFDQDNAVHADEVSQGRATVSDRPGLRMYCAVMTEQGMLWVGESPYRHNRYPFTPIWGYRYGRSGLPYGMVRGLRDLQEDINKRFSKSLFILSTNKVIIEEGAVSDIREFMREVARPDGIIQVKMGKLGAIKLDVDRDLAPAHMELMRQGIAMVQQVGGVTDEQMGRTTNATSGVAVQARQNQGMMQTSKLFDNLRLATKLQGEKQLSLIEQFFTEQKQFRITNMRGTPEYITINDGLPENDITRTKADFVIGEADWRNTMRQAQASELMDVMTRMPPQVAIVMLDLIIEYMDLPNTEELVRRIRQINGQKDPDQTEPTPEDIQREQQAQEQAQLQRQQIQLAMRELASKAGKNEAETQRILSMIDTQRATTANTQADTAAKAIAAAQNALIPGVAQVADALLKEAGFVPAQVAQANQELLAMQRAEEESQAMAAQARATQAQAAQAQAAQPQPAMAGIPDQE